MKSKNILGVPILLALLLIAVPAISQDKLLIIAPDDFIDKLEPLKRFKDCSGRPTTLLSLSQVYNNFPGYRDEAETVKRCIEHYERYHNIEHVLLVGDVDKFPVRWRWWGKPQQEYWGVSDLYYADLYKDGTTTFDDWDNNDNGLFGEIEFAPDGTINNDNVDFHPDVSVGRIPASTPAEVAAYVNKVITYELKTRPYDAWFKRAGLYTGCGNSWDNWNKDQVGTSLTNRGFMLLPTSEDDRIRYGRWCTPPPDPCCNPPLNMPQTIISDLNSGVGFANYIGHGNAWGWANLGFGSTQLSLLNNSGMLPVAFAAACDTAMFARMARFAPYKDEDGQGHWGTDNGETLDPGPYPHKNLPKPDCLQDGEVVHNGTTYKFDCECFAETFVFGNPVGSSGAIAYLGERTGGRQWARMLDRYFFEAYDSGGHDVLGDMWKYMIEEYYDYYDLENANTWPHQPSDWDWGHRFDEPQKLILFGDPSLVVGGAFKTNLNGNVYDGNGGPLSSYSRYRITGDVTVPAGQTLTAYSAASILFEDGKKITAIDPNPSNGFMVNGTSDKPVCFLSLAADPQSQYVVHGMKVSGQFRLRNGGEIKLY